MLGIYVASILVNEILDDILDNNSYYDDSFEFVYVWNNGLMLKWGVAVLIVYV